MSCVSRWGGKWQNADVVNVTSYLRAGIARIATVNERSGGIAGAAEVEGMVGGGLRIKR